MREYGRVRNDVSERLTTKRGNPPPDQSDHHGNQRNFLPLGKSGPPPSPGFEKYWVGGHGAKSTPFFLCMLLFHQTISAFEHRISKTGRYTNVVCCEVKNLHSEQHPGPSAVLSRAYRRWLHCAVVLFFSFLFFFSFHFLTFFPTLWLV